jgi:hypothetical protein
MRRWFEYKGRKGYADWPPDDTSWEEVFKRIQWQIDESYEGGIANAAECSDPALNVRWKWTWDKTVPHA